MVTGGSGVNGVWVVRQLLEEGITPIIYDWAPDMTLLQDIRQEIEVLIGDMRDIAALLRAIKKSKPDVIVHMAALMPPAAQADPKTGFEVNAGGTVRVLEAARIADVSRVVFTSSKAAYGEVVGEFAHPTYRPLSEDCPCRPVTVYDLAKVASEGMGMNYWREYGVDFVALRFASIYAPGKLARHGPMSVHSKLIENTMLNRPTHIPQGAEQRDDMIYVKDVAQGIVRAILAEKIGARVLNIGTGIGHTMVDMAEVLQEFYPDVRIEIGPGLDYMSAGVPYYSVFDITRARNELSFEPRFDLRAGVNDYIETMRRFGIQPTYTP